MSESTRRDVLFSLPAFSFLSLAAAAQQATATHEPPTQVQESAPGTQSRSQNGLASDLAHCAAFPFSKMPRRTSGADAPTHDILRGTLPTGESVELHETTVAAGKMPHPAHQHPHCEFILVREGTIEFSYGGAAHLLGPGSVGYTAPNELHGFRNPGPGDATYFIFSVGKR